MYGIPQEIPIKESHPTDPISSYGIVKLAIEKYLHLFWTLYGMEYRILRISNAYGARQPITPTQGAIASFLGKAAAKEEIVIWGDGCVVRDFFYVGDLAQALCLLLDDTGAYRVYNVGSGEGRSLRQVIAILEEVTGREARLRFESARPADVPYNILDVSRISRSLGWIPETSLTAGVEWTWGWVQAHVSGTASALPQQQAPLVTEMQPAEPILRS